MNTGREIVIRSAFEINPEVRQKIVAAIREQISKPGQKGRDDSPSADVNINFETSGSLICGIEIVADGRQVTWDLEGYLDELEQSFAEAFESRTAVRMSKIPHE
jgi:F-type H+-transporting ATPase subunit b